MDVRLRAGALALCAAALMWATQALAADPPTLKETLETSVGSMSLPASLDGVMTLTPCAQCPAKIFRSTVSTVYMLRDVPVSIAAFREAVLGKSDAYASVQFFKASKELVTVTANVPPPAAAASSSARKAQP
jgi:hypothetical protein